MNKSEIDIEEFKKMLNIKNDLDPEVISMIEKANTKYSLCNSAEQDDVILSIVKRVYNNGFSVSSQKRQAEWDRGWSGNINGIHGYLRIHWISMDTRNQGRFRGEWDGKKLSVH